MQMAAGVDVAVRLEGEHLLQVLANLKRVSEES
jgi:hypothetical protein